MSLLALMAMLAADPTPEPCREETSTSISVEEATQNYQQWADKCVIVEGWFSRRYLRADVEDYYLSSNYEVSVRNPSRATLGIASPYELLVGIRASDFGPLRTRAVGRIDHCDAKKYDGMWFFGSYCHDGGGSGPAFLFVENVQFDFARKLDRSTDALLASKVGNLVELPESDPNYRAAFDYIEDFLDAVRVDDEAAVFRLLGFSDGMEIDHDELAWVAADFSPIIEPALFRDLQKKVFRVDRRTSPEAAEDDPADIEVAVCYCRTGNCVGLWPISSLDADAHKSRPYVCVGYHRFSYKGQIEEYASAQHDLTLPEPVESAFERTEEYDQRLSLLRHEIKKSLQTPEVQ